jgi:hypothetical protein
VAVGVLGLVLAACSSSSGSTPTTTVPPTTTSIAAPATTTTVPTTTQIPAATVPATTAPSSSPPPPTTCPAWSGPTVTGRLDPALSETSGLAASRVTSGRIWANNDSGDANHLYLVDPSGRLLTTATLRGAGAFDWEDVAIGPGPAGDDRPWVWVADTGDNFTIRPVVSLYRFAEPNLGAAPPATIVIEVERIDVTYPDGAHDVEALMVDPVSGDAFLVAKGVERDGKVPVFRVAADQMAHGRTVAATEAARVVGETDGGNGPTAADISSDGTLVLISNGDEGFLWLRDPTLPVAAVLGASPLAPCRAPIEGGEAATFGAAVRNLWTVREGEGARLRRFDRG